MPSTYTKTVWVASTAPGISAGNLNNLETQYDCALEWSTTYLAPLASPPFTGTPNAPTAAAAVKTTQLATCEFVYNWHKSSTASDVVHVTDGTVYTQMNATPVLKKSFRIPAQYASGSEFRVKVTMKVEASGGLSAWCDIRSHTGKTYVTFTELTTTYTAKSTEFVIPAQGDIVELWCYAYAGKECYAKDYTICGTDTTNPAASW